MKALTRGAGRALPPRRLPVSRSRRSAPTSGRPAWPGSSATSSWLGTTGAAGRHQVAHAAARPAAVVRRSRPPSAHPRRRRGPDRAGHPGVDRHLLHQGGALADLRRLAPGFDLFRPRTPRAGHGLGGADRCQPRKPAAWRSCPRTASRGRCTTPPLGSRTASTAPARPSPSRSTRADATMMQLEAGSFSLHHTLCVHRSAPNRAAHRRVGLGINYIPGPCPADRLDAHVGDAGARHRQVGAFRPVRAAADGRVRHRDARPGLRALRRELSRAGEAARESQFAPQPCLTSAR